jgi:hypothetical protein
MDTLTTTPPADYRELVDYWNQGHENGVFPTSTPAMIEELQAQDKENKTTIENLRSTINMERSRVTNMENRIDSMIERLMQFVEDGDIENDYAEELASFFGRNLSRTVTVRVTADIDVEVTVPVGYDIDDLCGDLEVEITDTYASDIEVQSYETAGIQVEEM